MSRTVHISKNILISAAVAVLTAGGYGIYRTTEHHSAAKTAPVTTQQASAVSTTLRYRGRDGVDALTLLRQHTNVQTKSSSLGDYVVAINGNDGGGKKHWLFYINGRESTQGADTYITHGNEQIEWKLK